MERLLTNLQMRRADAYTIQNLGISSEQLMQRAGEAIAAEVEKAAIRLNAESVLIICGTGNNGGDGYVCAEILRQKSFKVSVYALKGKFSPDCAYRKKNYRGQYSDNICGAIIVDCIFGTGLCRTVEGEYAALINAINASGAYIVSADIPSGLNGDNGRICGSAVRADLTVAIAEYKTGMFLNDGPDCCGRIIKADIGIVCRGDEYANLLTADDIGGLYSARLKNTHKGTFGTASLIAGSEKYAGAAALAVGAALKSGCGYVKLTASEKIKFALVARFPQAIYADCPDINAEAVAIGPGCGADGKLYAVVKRALTECRTTVILDADALNALSEFGKEPLKEKNCKVILTPHLREFSRLTGSSVEKISGEPIEAAENFAREYGVTLLLKSSASIITDGRRTVINASGNSALAKGGSGDMLTGYLCGCVARGLAPFEACACAAFTLGTAAEIVSEEKTEYCATAEDILNALHLAVKCLTNIKRYG